MDARFEYQKASPARESPREEISVVDPEVHQRRLAYQKTAELHKKLGEIRPNAVFHSSVQRDAASDKLRIEAANSTASTFLTSMVARPNNGNSLTLVEQKVRTGQDTGYLLHSSEVSKPGFNSKNDRFHHYHQQVRRDVAQPGPGSYDTPARQDDIKNATTSIWSSSIFRDTTLRMDDPKGFRGTIKHANPTGPGQYNTTKNFTAKTFNKTLPTAGFV